MSVSKCNLCGFDSNYNLLRETKHTQPPQHLNYHYCRRCSFVSQNVDDTKLLAWYLIARQDQSDDILQRYFFQEMAETWSVINDLIALKKSIPETVDFILNGHNKTMADIGCGIGGSLFAYKTFGWKTIGVEPGERVSQYAREERKLNVKTEAYTRSSFPHASLDMIHSYHSIEHVPKPFQFMLDFSYHIKPGGLLYLETPNVLDTSQPQLGFEHISLFSPRILKQTLVLSGFEIIQTLDRSYFPTWGVGILARKRTDVDTAFYQDEKSYLPIDSLKWRRDSYFALKLGLVYAFLVGRSRKLTLLSSPWRMIEIVAKKYIAPLIRKLR